MDEKKMDEIEGQAVDNNTQPEENTVETVETPVETVGVNQENPVDSVEKAEEAVDNPRFDGEGIVEESVDTVEEMTSIVDKASSHKSNNWLHIALGVLLFVGFLGYCWYATGGGLTKKPDVGVAYAKENNVYVYDLKQEPFLAGETISNGGEYQYFSQAWGTGFSQSGDDLYFLTEISQEGIGKLYTRDLKNKGESVLIAESTFDYKTSQDGKTVGYLSFQDEAVVLSVYKNGENRAISSGILLEQGTYEVTPDGSAVAYIVGEGQNTAFFVCGLEEGSVPVKLTDAVAMYSVTDNNEIYYVTVADQNYNLYRYALGAEAALVAENIAYMTEFANGRDLLFTKLAEEPILYSSFIVDDITDFEGLTPEKQEAVTKIREAMAAGEGIEPLLQNAFMVTASGVVDTGKQIISVAPLGGDNGFYVGYGVKTPEPILLSSINSLEEALYAYYEGMAYGEKDVFVGNTRGETFSLQTADADPTSLVIDQEGKTVAYYVADPATGTNILMTETLGGKEPPTTVASYVENTGFLGKGNTLGYFYDYADGVGRVGVFEKGEPTEITATGSRVFFAQDRAAIYYIADMNPATGNGDLMVWEKGKSTLLAEDVFNFQYKNNGKLAYLKGYVLEEALGDLYYFDGKTSVPLDTGVSALFMN